MRHGRWVDAPDELRSASWEGVIKARELVQLGVPERTAYRRTQEDGPWTLLLPATFLLSNGTPTPRQLEIAALVYAGPDALLTGLGGARHHGLRRGGEPTVEHVLVPIERQVASVGRVLVERTRRMPEPMERDGLPVAPLGRCLMDHSHRTKDLETIAAPMTEAVQRRMLRPEALRLELERGTRKGSAAPRRVLDGVDDNVWSVAEFDARAFWTATAGLPPIEWNVPVYDESGMFIGFADGLVREVGLVWELDSVEHHFATPDQVRATLERHRRLRAAGLYVLSSRPAQRRDDPDGLREDIRAALEIARHMPPARARYGHAAS